jgi:hypothetical protein
MEAAGPINSDITLSTIEASCSFHATSCTDTTELKEAIEYRTIIPNIEFGLLFDV